MGRLLVSGYDWLGLLPDKLRQLRPKGAGLRTKSWGPWLRGGYPQKILDSGDRRVKKTSTPGSRGAKKTKKNPFGGGQFNPRLRGIPPKRDIFLCSGPPVVGPSGGGNTRNFRVLAGGDGGKHTLQKSFSCPRRHCANWNCTHPCIDLSNTPIARRGEILGTAGQKPGKGAHIPRWCFTQNTLG